MTITTPTKARANLSGLLKRALEGDDVGIEYGGRIIALRPVELTPAEYVQAEYGLSPEEWARVTKNLHEKAKESIRTGKAKLFTGNIEDALNG